jgi:ABC-type multidrug transport system ATPase subunit
MITVIEVTHHYGVKPVLRDISLHVRRGELLALMGPNGMGKSTLLGVMAGLLAPYRGYVEVDGKRRRRTVEEEEAIRKQVAYLPAEAWVAGSFTGREWLLAVGRLYGIEALRLMDHVDRLLALFNLTEQGDSQVSSYSSGQKKKIALAGALVSEAPLLLLDEPFAGGLDPSGILALKHVLQRLTREQGVTVVMATPVPELVEELADRIAIVRDGRLVACDTIDGLQAVAGGGDSLDEIYERLASPHTAENVDRYFATGGVA